MKEGGIVNPTQGGALDPAPLGWLCSDHQSKGESMDKRVRIALLVAGAFLLWAVVVPPLRSQRAIEGVRLPWGYVYWEHLWRSGSQGAWDVAWSHLALEVAAIAVVTGMVIVSLGLKEK